MNFQVLMLPVLSLLPNATLPEGFTIVNGMVLDPFGDAIARVEMAAVEPMTGSQAPTPAPAKAPVKARAPKPVKAPVLAPVVTPVETPVELPAPVVVAAVVQPVETPKETKRKTGTGRRVKGETAPDTIRACEVALFHKRESLDTMKDALSVLQRTKSAPHLMNTLLYAIATREIGRTNVQPTTAKANDKGLRLAYTLEYGDGTKSTHRFWTPKKGKINWGAANWPLIQAKVFGRKVLRAFLELPDGTLTHDPMFATSKT